jgi:hypothetical protein
MCDLFGGSAPQPPNPLQTAAAQTGTNVSTAVANAFLNNTNQVTPQGNLTYQTNPSDNYSWSDPTTGQTYSIPRFTAIQTPTAQQARTQEQSEAARYWLSTLANTRSGQLADQYSSGINLANAPTAGDPSAIGQGAPNFTFGDAPAIQTGVGPFGETSQEYGQAQNPQLYDLNAFGGTGTQQQQTGFDPTAALQYGFGAQGGPSSTYGGQGSYITGLGPWSQQTGFDPTTGAQRTYGDAGAQQFGFADAGQQQGQFGATPGSVFGFGGAGDITRSYGPQDNFSADRQRVEESLFGRLNPQLDRQRSQIQQQLADQGIRYGSPAYTAAMDDFNRQANDLRLGVTAQGGQEQQRLNDMAAQQAGFQNAAQMQEYNQQRGRGEFYNAAEAQAFQEAQARGEFGNRAQQAAFGQAQARGTFANEAQRAAAAEALQRGTFANEAERQQYTEALGRGTFANEANQRIFENMRAAGQFANEAQAQAAQEALQRGTFANQAQAQGFGQEQARAQFSNAAAEEAFQQAQARGAFYNTAQAAGFGQNVQRGQIYNAAQAEQERQQLARANYANQAAQQQYEQQLGLGTFANQAQGNIFSQMQLRSQFANQALAQQQQMAQARVAAQDAARNRYLAEQYQLRNQPINEISALLSGSQVSQPQFVNTPTNNIPTTDVAGLINQNFSQNFQNYQAQQQLMGQIIGGTLGAAGSIGAGLAFRSDRRSKENIHRIGTVFAAERQPVQEPERKKLPVYEYSYKDDPSSMRHIGPMAQDMEKIDPGAVGKDKRGMRYINASRMMGAILRAA